MGLATPQHVGSSQTGARTRVPCIGRQILNHHTTREALIFSPFFVVSLSGFSIRVMVASENEFGSVPSSAIFWKSFKRIGVSSSLNV